MSSYKRALNHIKNLEDRLFFQLLEGAKEKIAVGKVYPSTFLADSWWSTQLNKSPGFIRDMLTDKDNDRLEDRQIAHNAGHGFGAAT